MDDDFKKAIAASIETQKEKELGFVTVSDEDKQLAEAVEKSLLTNQGRYAGGSVGAGYEPLNPEQRKREENQPCGL